MQHMLNSDQPIFQQIAQYIEDEIIKGALKEEEQVPSTNQFAAHFQINPATAAKGINQLVDQGILYKKRGIGMFVASGAYEQLIEKRKQLFFEEHVQELLSEAEKLKISTQEIIQWIERKKERDS